MDYLYDIIYELINNINNERNAINDFFYTSNLIVGDIFSVNNGLAVFNAPVDINHTVSNISNPLDYALYVVGGVYIGKNLYVNGNIISNYDVNIYGNLEIYNYLRVNGNAILGNIYLYSNLEAGTIIAKNIISTDINGNIYSFNITGFANIETLNANNMELVNIENIVGNQIICSIFNSNNIDSNNITANIVNIVDKVIGNTLIINHQSNILDTLTVYGGANISGNVNVEGNIQLLGDLFIENLFRINGNLDIYGNLNLFNANLLVKNNLVTNKDTYIYGNIYCDNIITNERIISNINNIFIESNVTLEIYSNIAPQNFFANLNLLKENKSCCIRTRDNISGIIYNTTPYIYANLGIFPELEQYVPNVPINKNMNLTDGTNIGFNYLVTGNIYGNIELLNLYFPDYVASNSTCIRLERFNRKNFTNGFIDINKFSISYIL